MVTIENCINQGHTDEKRYYISVIKILYHVKNLWAVIKSSGYLKSFFCRSWAFYSGKILEGNI